MVVKGGRGPRGEGGAGNNGDAIPDARLRDLLANPETGRQEILAILEDVTEGRGTLEQLIVSPVGRVELVLGGLARGTRRLDPVSFGLSRHRGTSIDRMYWLEAVGSAMAVLTYPYGGM